MNEYIVRIPSDMPYEIKAELNAWYVNSEPIVRCRDCEFYVRDELGECCTLMDFERVGGMADGFCAWGERKGANYERQDD